MTIISFSKQKISAYFLGTIFMRTFQPKKLALICGKNLLHARITILTINDVHNKFILYTQTIYNIHTATYHHLLHNFFTSLKTHPFQPWHTTTHQCHFPLNWHMKMNRVETKEEQSENRSNYTQQQQKKPVLFLTTRSHNRLLRFLQRLLVRRIRVFLRGSPSNNKFPLVEA